MFLAPVKRSKAFVSEIRTKSGKPFLIKLVNVHVQDVFHLKDHKGHLLQVGLQPEASAFDAIRTLDELALQETLQRKGQWFPNSKLSKERVLEYFRSSMTSFPSNCIQVMVSESREPSHISWLGESIECFDVLMKKGKRAIRDATATLQIEAHGIYFYEQKFGIRWVLRSASFGDSEVFDDTSIENHIEREEIEGFWIDEMEDINESVEKDIMYLREKIQQLEMERERLQGLLSQVRELPDISVEWNLLLDELRDRVGRYRGGQISAK